MITTIYLLSRWRELRFYIVILIQRCVVIVEMAPERGTRRGHLRDWRRRHGHADRTVHGRHEVQSDHSGRYGPQTWRYYFGVTGEVCQKRQNGCRSSSSKGFFYFY